MYELYREKLLEHMKGLNDNTEASVKVLFKDISEKSGLTVESQMKVHQKTQNGCGKPKYTINLYHTNNSMMVNGRDSTQFNAEHLKIAEHILDSEQVSMLNQAIFAQIQNELKSICVNSKSQKKTKRASQCGPSMHTPELNTSGVSPQPAESTLCVRPDDEPEPLSCPTCDQRLDSRDSVCCDRCDLWYHLDCEMINPEMCSLLQNSDIGYTCLVCTHEVQCEDLNESLDLPDRNVQEAMPDESREETHRKIGYEPGPVRHETPIHNRLHPQPKGGTTPQQTRMVTPHLPTKPPTAHASSEMQNRIRVSVNNRNSAKEQLERPQRDASLVNQNTQMQSVSDNEPNIEVGKSSKPQKKVNKSKIKETEQEEQLKLSRSVINSLERKLSEIENSNKILKQENAVLKAGTSTIGVAQVNENNGGNPMNNLQQCIHHGEVSQHKHDICLGGVLREQVRNLEYEVLRNRISTLEATIQQQNFLHSLPPGFHGHNPHQQNWYRYGPQPHSGFQTNLYHPWIHPATVPFPVHHPTVLNPLWYQGYPMGPAVRVPMGQVQTPQNTIPRQNLVFRNEANLQNTAQGFRHGNISNVSPEYTRARQSEQQRENLVFRYENSMQGKEQNQETQPGRELKQHPIQRTPSVGRASSGRPESTELTQDGNEKNNGKGSLSDPILLDGIQPKQISPASGQKGTMPTVGNSTQNQQQPVCGDREPTRPVFGPERPDDDPLVPTRTQNGANKQPFLVNGRASEKRWKRGNC